MSIAITAYAPEHESAVQAFNARLRQADVLYHFPESHVPTWLPKLPGRNLFQEFYVATEGATVRGGYLFKRQDFVLGDRVRSLGNLSLPLSEGVLEPRFISLGVSLYLHAIRREPMAYSLGIGYREEAFAKLLLTAGWQLWDVPFFVRIVRPAAFLRKVAALRTTVARRCVLDALAYSGLGSLGIRGLQALTARKHRRTVADYHSESFQAFDASTDELWEQTKGQYSLSAVRDAETLNILYPANSRFVRIRVLREGKLVGWTVVLNSQMQGHKFFGDLKVGTLVDCDALPEAAPAVVAAAVRHLQQDNSDVIITNQSNLTWQAAVRAAGFIERPTNFLFAASKSLLGELQAVPDARSRLHMTRGDGNGPFNL